MATVLTPPSPESEVPDPHYGVVSPSDENFNEAALSPFRASFQHSPVKASPASTGPPLSARSNFTTSNGTASFLPLYSPTLENGQTKGPFNFTPMSIAKSPVSKSVS